MKNDKLGDLLNQRFGDTSTPVDIFDGENVLLAIAARRSCREFENREVPDQLVRTLSAAALCAPTKSDLQQRDILLVKDASLRLALLEPIEDQAWTTEVPTLLVFLANNRRQRQLHDWRGHSFANDHLDAFFNASLDAGIALATFVIAAEAVGLGCCPISALRNHADQVSELLGLPDHVFPVAGLALGYPSASERTGPINMRLPLKSTFHVDRFDDNGIAEAVAAYDGRRARAQPYAAQRAAEHFGTTNPYTWSEDKARQYALPERADFGTFVRQKGFRLD